MIRKNNKFNSIRNKNHNQEIHNAFHFINLTPIIDLMLVLMIIFIFSAQGLISGIKIELPKAQNSQTDQSNENIYINISINKENQIFLNDNPTINIINDLNFYISQNSINKDKVIIILNIDSSIQYGSVISLIDNLRNANYYKTFFATINKDKIDKVN